MPTAPRTWVVMGLARRLLWVQLGACAVLLALFGTDAAMVAGHVSCAVYRRTIQGVPGTVLADASVAIGAGALLWRLAAQIAARQARAVALSLALVAVEIALLGVTLNAVLGKTLFYCAFEGVQLNVCEMGLCAH